MECSVWSSVLTQLWISAGILTWQRVAKWPEQPHWKQFPSLLGSHHIYPLKFFFPPPELPWSPPPELVQLPPDLPLLRADNGEPFLSPQDRCPEGFEFWPWMISAVSVGLGFIKVMSALTMFLVEDVRMLRIVSRDGSMV